MKDNINIIAFSYISAVSAVMSTSQDGTIVNEINSTQLSINRLISELKSKYNLHNLATVTPEIGYNYILNISKARKGYNDYTLDDENLKTLMKI